MRRGQRVAWLLLAVWSTWLFALQGFVAHAAPGGLALGAWTPDLGLALLVALGGRAPAGRLRVAALVVGCARAAASVDPPAACLAGYLALAPPISAVRAGIDAERASVRFALAALAALFLGAWLVLAAASARTGAPRFDWPPGLVAHALSTGFAAILLGPALARLPGLRPLREGR